MEWVKGIDKQEYIDDLLKGGFVNTGANAIYNFDEIKYYEPLEAILMHPQLKIKVNIFAKHASIFVKDTYLGKEFFQV